MGKWTAIVFGLITIALIYSAANILPFYYYYFELVNQMEAHTKVAQIYSDKELREKLMYHIHKMELPVDPSDLIIERRSDTITFRLKYREIFYITWGGKDYDLHVFEFDAHATGPIAQKR